jgi:Mg-chelatase subunit ChlD
VTDIAELDLDADLDELEDFDSPDRWAPKTAAPRDYVAKMWEGWGFDRVDRTSTRAITIAHGMVQSFLNSFARDGRYVAVFNKNMKTAGTEHNVRRTIITPSPILDETITAIEAGEVLTGLAVHEICHPRYGKDTTKAVIATFPRSSAAKALSNLLDDVRIERRFVDEYPGYAGIFEPTRRYVANGLVTRNGGVLIECDADHQVNLAISAVRYADVTRWDGIEEYRDWWIDWAERGSREDSPRRHVEAIREGLRFIVATRARLRKEREEEAARVAEEQERLREEQALVENDVEPEELAPDDDHESGSDEPDLDDTDLDDDAEADVAPDDAAEPEDDEPDADPGPNEPEPGDDESEPGDEPGQDPEEDDEPLDAPGLDGDVGDPDPEGDADPGDDEEVPDDGDETREVPAGDDDLEDGMDDVEDWGDEEIGDAADEGGGMAGQPPTCDGSTAVDEAAGAAGVSPGEISHARDRAQQQIDEDELYESDGHGGRVDVARTMKGLLHGELEGRDSRKFRRSEVASRYIRDALLQSRTGHTDTTHYQKRGRLDTRALHRVAQQDFRLFDRRRSESAGRFLIWMLLDRSASMDGDESVQQAQVATAIAEATRHVRTVRAAVWAWSNSFRNNDDDYDVAGVALAWRTGQPTGDIAKTADLGSGGTPDAAVLGWATDAIRREVKGAEQPIIIMCSDGWGDQAMTARVAEARARGVRVVSVAFGGLDEETQLERFGPDNYVTWQGGIIETARPLSKMIARIIGRDRR